MPTRIPAALRRTLLPLLLLFVIGAGALPVRAEILRLPKTDNPALAIEPRPGWTPFYDEYGNLRFTAADRSCALLLSMIPDDKAGGTPDTEVAANIYKAAGAQPYSRVEPGTIAGISGQAFISTMTNDKGVKLEMRVVLVKPDPTHYASVAVMMTSTITPEQTTELEAMAALVRIRGEDEAQAVAKGDAAYAKKDYDLAIANYNEAIRLDANYAEAFCDRGLAQEVKGDTALALADYNAAIQLNPGLARAYKFRGVIQAGKRNYERAIADYSEAIRLSPDYANAYASRGDAYSNQHDYVRAIADYSNAIRLNPDYAAAFANRGTAYSHQGDYERAIADYTEALRLYPDYASVCNRLAWLRATAPGENFRDGPKAVELATKACELTKWKQPAYVDTLAAAAAEAGNFDDAVKWETQYLAGDLTKEAADTARERLALYQQKEPYHQPEKAP